MEGVVLPRWGLSTFATHYSSGHVDALIAPPFGDSHVAKPFLSTLGIVPMGIAVSSHKQGRLAFWWGTPAKLSQGRALHKGGQGAARRDVYSIQRPTLALAKLSW